MISNSLMVKSHTYKIKDSGAFGKSRLAHVIPDHFEHREKRSLALVFRNVSNYAP